MNKVVHKVATIVYNNKFCSQGSSSKDFFDKKLTNEERFMCFHYLAEIKKAIERESFNELYS